MITQPIDGPSTNSGRAVWRLLAFLLLFPLYALAQEAAQITHATGTVHVKKADGSLKIASVGSSLSVGDVVSTEAKSSIRLRFGDGTEIVLKSGTQLQIEQYHYQEAKPANDALLVNLAKGGLRTVSGVVGKRGNANAFGAKTAVGSIGIRGTQFGMVICEPGQCPLDEWESMPEAERERLSEGGLFFEVTEGGISFTNGAGEFAFDAPAWGHTARFDAAPLMAPEGVLPLRGTLPLVSTQESIGGLSSGLGTDPFAQCTVQ
jgi:hypothetical protein